jgi:hypothetical protein
MLHLWQLNYHTSDFIKFVILVSYIRNKQLDIICSKAITYFPLMEYIHLKLVSVALFSNELVLTCMCLSSGVYSV